MFFFPSRLYGRKLVRLSLTFEVTWVTLSSILQPNLSFFSLKKSERKIKKSVLFAVRSGGKGKVKREINSIFYDFFKFSTFVY